MKHIKTILVAFTTSLVMYFFSRLQPYQDSINNIFVILLVFFFTTIVFGYILPQVFEKEDVKPKKVKNKADEFITGDRNGGRFP